MSRAVLITTRWRVLAVMVIGAAVSESTGRRAVTPVTGRPVRPCVEALTAVGNERASDPMDVVVCHLMSSRDNNAKPLCTTALARWPTLSL